MALARGFAMARHRLALVYYCHKHYFYLPVMVLEWIFCSILFTSIPFHSIPIFYYTILYYTILYYTILYYTILYCTVLYCTVLFCTALHYTILHYTVLYVLHYTTLHYTTLHYYVYSVLSILFYLIVYTKSNIKNESGLLYLMINSYMGSQDCEEVKGEYVDTCSLLI